MNNSKAKIKVNFYKTYSVPREYLTGDEEYELQLIRKRLKKRYREEYESQLFKEKMMKRMKDNVIDSLK